MSFVYFHRLIDALIPTIVLLARRMGSGKLCNNVGYPMKMVIQWCERCGVQPWLILLSDSLIVQVEYQHSDIPVLHILPIRATAVSSSTCLSGESISEGADRMG